MTVPIPRRRMLLGSLAAGGAATVAALAGPGQPRAVADETRRGTEPFEGAHQAGVLSAPSAAVTFVSLDVTAPDRAGLTDLLRAVTDQARLLTAGGALGDAGMTAPPADNGVLGSRPPADGLTVTVGVGASLFDDRFGLSALRPAKLTP